MNERSAVIRILLVDDHSLVRQVVGINLSMEGDIEIVGQSINGKEALDACGELLPDVVLMDQCMPIMDGVEATKMIKSRHPDVAVVMLTNDPVSAPTADIKDSGANCHIHKLSSKREMLSAVRSAHVGETNLDLPD